LQEQASRESIAITLKASNLTVRTTQRDLWLFYALYKINITLALNSRKADNGRRDNPCPLSAFLLECYLLR